MPASEHRIHCRAASLLATLAILSGCVAAPTGSESRAQQLAQRLPIIDTHIDVPYRLEANWSDVTAATADGDFDYPRARAGGLTTPFMSIYVPASLEENGGGKALADQLIDRMEALVGRAPDKFALARSSDDVIAQARRGLISIALGMENGTPIEGDLANLTHFYKRGIRYITLAHSMSNHISDSSYDDNRAWGGLSPFGREVVREMNRLGIIVDISHLSDDAARDVLEVSEVPVFASHSSVRAFTPGWERNMDDELIRRLAANGGVININFGSTFLNPVTRQYSEAMSAAREAYMEDNDIESTSDERVRQFNLDYRERLPYPFATIDDVLNHFDHVVQLVGIDYVGVGSDFDGVGNSLPVGLKDVSMYPNLIAGLLDRGYSEADIEKILYRNNLRVWRAAEAYARQ